MKDDIKEILSDMFHIICKYSDDFDDLEENEIRYQLPYTKMEKLYDYITNLQEKVNQYENPDDMTLFYMWLDEKAKDKMKELQKENDYYFKKNNELSSLNTSLRSDRDNYKSKINKARHKLNIMFSNGNEDIILDDLLELDKILGEDK